MTDLISREAAIALLFWLSNLLAFSLLGYVIGSVIGWLIWGTP